MKKGILLLALLLCLFGVAYANDDDTYVDDDTWTDDDTWVDDDTWMDDDTWIDDDDSLTDDDTSIGDDDSTDDDTADTGGGDDDNGSPLGCAVASGNPALPLTMIMLGIGLIGLVIRRFG